MNILGLKERGGIFFYLPEALPCRLSTGFRCEIIAEGCRSPCRIRRRFSGDGYDSVKPAHVHCFCPCTLVLLPNYFGITLLITVGPLLARLGCSHENNILFSHSQRRRFAQLRLSARYLGLTLIADSGHEASPDWMHWYAHIGIEMLLCFCVALITLSHGFTGNIGGGVLEACLRDPTVTSIIALSRRPVKVEDPKLKVIIHGDFSSYTDEIYEEALSCDGAIW